MKRSFEFNLESCLAPTKQCTVSVKIPPTTPIVPDTRDNDMGAGIVPDPQSAALKMLDAIINGTASAPFMPPLLQPLPLSLPQPQPPPLSSSHEPDLPCANLYQHAGLFREYGGVVGWMKFHAGVEEDPM